MRTEFGTLNSITDIYSISSFIGKFLLPFHVQRYHFLPIPAKKDAKILCEFLSFLHVKVKKSTGKGGFVQKCLLRVQKYLLRYSNNLRKIS